MPAGKSAVYGMDLAWIHHQGYGDFARSAAPAILDRITALHGTGGTVVDLGCGSGILAEVLVRGGLDVLGIDLSEDMIRLARERVPKARFARASFVDVELPPCVAVTAIGEVLGYCFDPRSRKDTMLSRLFARIHRRLVRDGLLLFDLAGPGRVSSPGQKPHIRESDDWLLYTHASEDPRTGCLTRNITTFRSAGRPGLWHRTDETHVLRLRRPGEVLAMLRNAGFRARTLKQYGERPFPPGLTAYVARKP